MIALLAIVLEKIGDAFLGALAGKVTDEVWTRLKGDPAKTALKQALRSVTLSSMADIDENILTVS